MYIYNLFCFGIDPKKINIENIDSIDFHFSFNDYSVETHYHVNNGTQYVIGKNITDDDDNPDYIDEVRSSKKEYFIDDYNKFKIELIKVIEEDIKIINDNNEGDDVVSILEEFKKNIIEIEPDFYTVEVSS